MEFDLFLAITNANYLKLLSALDDFSLGITGYFSNIIKWFTIADIDSRF
jgi:hypothetical protein